MQWKLAIIADELQPLEVTRRVFEETLGDTVDDISAWQWDTDAVGGISLAAMQSEQGEEFEVAPEWRDALSRTDVLVTHFYPVRIKVFDACPRLRLVASMRHGLENVDEQEADRRSIDVVNNPGRTADAVSDFALGCIVSQMRGIIASDRGMREGRWLQPYEVAPHAHDISCATIGIVGYGHVGRLLARKLRSFGCRILAYDPYFADGGNGSEAAELVDLPDLLRASDAVSLHVRVSDETRGMIGRREVEMMKRSAVLVNTARAELVDEEALVSALREGRIAGAHLDVFWREPLPPDDPLLELPTLSMTPHLAGSTSDSELVTARNLANRLARMLEQPVTR